MKPLVTSLMFFIVYPLNTGAPCWGYICRMAEAGAGWLAKSARSAVDKFVTAVKMSLEFGYWKVTAN